MKRKSCLIEPLEENEQVFKKKQELEGERSLTMYKSSTWYQSLLDAEKSCLKEDQIKKVHYKFKDNTEMVEEYNVDTHVMLRRAWKIKSRLGGEGKWNVEVGDPIPEVTTIIDAADIIEAKDQPVITRRNTRVNLEWRIRNLPYPIETYSISANNDEKSIIVKTTNKKYFKKLNIPELARLNLPVEQPNIQSNHQFNTLIILYKKPQLLLEMEKDWFEELKKVKPIKDIPNECKTQ